MKKGSIPVYGLALALFLLAFAASAVRAENAPGVTATEIKLGQTVPYDVPLGSFGHLAKAELAYFQWVNDQGGINGRKINLISLDDGAFDVPKAVELTHKLVEEDQVAAIFATVGDEQNLAIRQYLNDRKIPQLFTASAADVAGDYKHFPWTIAGLPVFRVEGQIYAHYVLREMPNAKVAVLYEDDGFGKTYVTGLKEGFGAEYAKYVVKEISYDPASATIDAQIAELQATHTDVLISAASPRFAIMLLRKLPQGNWHPTHIISNISASVDGTLKLAGLANAKGLITATSYLDPASDDPSLAPFHALLSQYLPGASKDDFYYLVGYTLAQAMVQVLRQCGDDLSRENIMRQAANLRDFHPVGLLPGVSFNTNRTKYLPIVEGALERFDGEKWVVFGDIMAGR